MNPLSRRDALKAVTTGLTAGTVEARADQPEPSGKLPTEKPFLVLTCDGGGIRGLLAARIVQRIQEDLAKEKPSGNPIDFCKRINCFAGTSTGGIISLGLAAGLLPDKLVNMYQKEGPNIFQRYTPDNLGIIESAYYKAVTEALGGIDRLLGRLPLSPIPPNWSKNSDQLFFTQYDQSALRKVLEKEMGKELTLGRLAATRSALVTSLLLGTTNDPWRPVLLHNLPVEDDDARMSREMTVVDAALCTSAAPTYFAPHHVETVGYFADGGVFANSPGVAAVTVALRSGQMIENIRVLSLGTGSVGNYMKVPPWDHLRNETGGTRCGLLAWLYPKARDGVPAIPLVAAMFDAGAKADELYCRGLLKDRYHRIQISLEKDNAMDDVSAIPRLIELADAYFDSKRWKDEDRKWVLETYLSSRFTPPKK